MGRGIGKTASARRRDQRRPRNRAKPTPAACDVANLHGDFEFALPHGDRIGRGIASSDDGHVSPTDMCDWHFVFFVFESYGLRLPFASKKIANFVLL
jgi:hypothetical protein